jgi:predicted MPP superfamily phosphohydrolase
VQLSDLHFGPYVREEALRRWVDAALAEHPELIVITGDFVDLQATGEMTALPRQLARLKASLGVYGVWGNHDYANFGRAHIAELGRLLSGADVRILTNAGVPLREDLYLAGVDDFGRGCPRLEPALAARPPDAACLLLSHNPDIIPQVPRNIGLTLCGHTHGGQVKLPFVGALMTSSTYGRRFAEGWITEPADAFVSRGLGFSMLPVRWNCRAEMVVIDLLPTLHTPLSTNRTFSYRTYAHPSNGENC